MSGPTDIAALHRAFLSGKARPSAHLEARLARIADINPRLNAIVTLTDEPARQAAAASDARYRAGAPLGPLDGITVGIKDITETEGVRTTYGSPLFADNVPEEDALSVARMKAAGAVMVGKTNTSEFAAGAHTVNDVFGVTRNPWNLALSPGGSTGGGAAGLAAGLFDLALGSDLGGSLRTPAAFCGVMGLRPTPGLIPKQPDPVPFDPLSVDGPMARTAMGLAHALDVLAAPDPGDPKAPPPDWRPRFAETLARGEPGVGRVAYAADVAGIGIDTEIEALCRTAALGLKDDASLVDVDLSAGRQAFLPLRAQHILGSNLDLAGQTDALGPNIGGNIRLGLEQAARDIADAEAVRAGLWRRMTAFFSDFDVLLTPCTAVPPFPVEQNHPTTINGVPMTSYIDWVAPNFVFSILGLPAISVPVGLDSRGLPAGLQVIAPRHGEARLLCIAEALASRHPMPMPLPEPGTG